jgi:hypothetical protein
MAKVLELVLWSIIGVWEYDTKFFWNLADATKRNGPKAFL